MVASTGPAVLWLLFGAWAVHDAEELLVGPRWLAQHEPRLEGMAERSNAVGRFLAATEGDRRALGVSIGLIGLFVLAATLLGALDPTGPGMLVYATVLGGFALHVGVHLAQSVAFRGYAPGVVTAVVVVVPACSYLYAALLSGGYVTLGVAVVAAVVGLAIVVPTALVTQRVGRRVAARWG